MSNVKLSAADWRMAADASFILTKNRVIAEVYQLFGGLADAYRKQAAPLAHRYPGVFAIHPKISKGEQYEGMPWVMLDYPRCFGADGHFAIRSFFWWGNFFSLRVQLSGQWLHAFTGLPEMLAKEENWYCGFTHDPWPQHLPNAGWQPAPSALTGRLPGNDMYFMAATKIPISRWEDAEVFYHNGFSTLMRAMQTK